MAATDMPITVRRMRSRDARAFLEVHHAAVRGLASADYSPAVIEDWAPIPVMEEQVERFLANPDGELRLVAETDRRIVGVGALIVARSELRACYVVPDAARKGVGTSLVREIERLARANGLSRLRLESSLNAEPFYAALGYAARGRAEHISRSGLPAACVRMERALV